MRVWLTNCIYLSDPTFVWVWLASRLGFVRRMSVLYVCHFLPVWVGFQPCAYQRKRSAFELLLKVVPVTNEGGVEVRSIGGVPIYRMGATGLVLVHTHRYMCLSTLSGRCVVRLHVYLRGPV